MKNQDYRSADEIMKTPMADLRMELSDKFLASRLTMDDFKPLSMKAIDRALAFKSLSRVDLAREIKKANSFLQTGKCEENPDISHPMMQYVWGLALAICTMDKNLRQKWTQPEKSQPVNYLEVWKRIRESYTAQAELKKHAFMIQKMAIFNNSVKMKWGACNYPQVGYYFDSANNIINLDMLWGLIGGFEHTRAAQLHEIGHSQGTVVFTKKMRALEAEYKELKAKAAAGTITADEAERMQRVHKEFNFRFELFDEAENSYANRFAVNAADFGILRQDIAYDLNAIETELFSIGKDILENRANGGTQMNDNLGNRAYNLKRAIRYSFFINNGILPDNEEGWRQIGVRKDWIEFVGTDGQKVTGDPAFEQLLEMTRKLEVLQAGMRDYAKKDETRKEIVLNYAEQRCDIIDAIYDGFAADYYNQAMRQPPRQQSDQKGPSDGADNGPEGLSDNSQSENHSLNNVENDDNENSGGDSNTPFDEENGMKGGEGQPRDNGEHSEPPGFADEKQTESEASKNAGENSEQQTQPQDKPSVETKTSPQAEPQQSYEENQESQAPEKESTTDGHLEPQTTSESRQPVHNEEDKLEDDAPNNIGKDSVLSADNSESQENSALTPGEEMSDEVMSQLLDQLIQEMENQEEITDIKLPEELLQALQNMKDLPQNPQQQMLEQIAAMSMLGEKSEADDDEKKAMSILDIIRTPLPDAVMPENSTPKSTSPVRNKIEFPKMLMPENEYTKIVEKHAGLIEQMKAKFTEMQNQYLGDNSAERSLAIIPDEGNFDVDMDSFLERIKKQRLGSEVTEKDYENFYVDGKPGMERAPIDIAILIDTSGSMSWNGYDRFATEMGCAMYQATRDNPDFNVYVALMTDPTTWIAKPGDNSSDIAKRLASVEKLGITDDKIGDNICAVLKEVAQQKSATNAEGFTNFFMITDSGHTDSTTSFPMVNELCGQELPLSFNWLLVGCSLERSWIKELAGEHSKGVGSRRIDVAENVNKENLEDKVMMLLEKRVADMDHLEAVNTGEKKHQFDGLAARLRSKWYE